jgi:hypothetical protein
MLADGIKPDALYRERAVSAFAHSVNTEKSGRTIVRMTYPRVTAAIFVLLLIGCFALIGVVGVALVGPEMTHSLQAEHEAGTIVAISTDSFTLKMSNGKQVSFQCVGSCKEALQHMGRHETEKAHTDVYYTEVANNIFRALDVD